MTANTKSTKRSQDLICSIGSCKGADTYTVDGRCYNCGWKGSVMTTKGHDFVIPRTCPNCGCQEVRRG